MFTTEDELEEQLFSLRYSPETEETERMLLKCISESQRFKNIDLEFDARYMYVKNAVFINKAELAIAMFPWLLKKCDEERERFDYFDVLWSYKWIIGHIHEYTRIPLQTIENLYLDLEKRYVDFGEGRRMFYYLKMQYYDVIGELEQAKEYFNLYKKTKNKKGYLDDCVACQHNNVINHTLSQYEYKLSFKEAKPIFESGRVCHEVPQTTYSKMVLAALATQKMEEAEQNAFLAKKSLPIKINNMLCFATLILFYTIKKDWVKGRNLIEKQVQYIYTSAAEYQKFYFLLSVEIFIKQLINDNKRYKSIKFKYQNKVENADVLLSEIQPMLQKIIIDFNTRNGNNYYTDQYNEWYRILNLYKS
ncbi:MAG: hypothetical protein RLZZ175_2873 [Bacteroidota bacterium]|jgi:hypothetical protein